MSDLVVKGILRMSSSDWILSPVDVYKRQEKIRRDIIRQLKDEILVTPKVKLVKKGSLPQSEGKAVRVKDLRDNKMCIRDRINTK